MLRFAREKQIKGWLRSKKIALIDSMNPKWKDLSEEWYVSNGGVETLRSDQGDTSKRAVEVFIEKGESRGMKVLEG